jgi:hypothetical protein
VLDTAGIRQARGEDPHGSGELAIDEETVLPSRSLRVMEAIA